MSIPPHGSPLRDLKACGCELCLATLAKFTTQASVTIGGGPYIVPNACKHRTPLHLNCASCVNERHAEKEALAKALPDLKLQVIRAEDLRPGDLVLVKCPEKLDYSVVADWAYQTFKPYRCQVGVMNEFMEVTIIRSELN